MLSSIYYCFIKEFSSTNTNFDNFQIIFRLFLVHFMLTDKGKEIQIDEKLKSKCELAQKLLSVNTDD